MRPGDYFAAPEAVMETFWAYTDGLKLSQESCPTPAGFWNLALGFTKVLTTVVAVAEIVPRIWLGLVLNRLLKLFQMAEVTGSPRVASSAMKAAASNRDV